jgi:hypothetical protein
VCALPAFVPWRPTCSPGILNTGKWLPRARLCKLLISQSADGWWDPCTTTAFALEARPQSELKALPNSRMDRLMAVASGVGAEMLSTLLDDDDDLDRKRDVRGFEGVAEDITAAAEQEAHRSRRISLVRSLERARAIDDCPITSMPEHILEAMPRSLVAARHADPEALVLRVWTTLCCIAFLERQAVSFIWGDGCVLTYMFIFWRRLC